MYTNGCNGGYQFVSSEIFFFSSLLEIRWDSTRGRTGSRIYPSRGMIYHRDVPLKSFLSETCSLQNRVTAPSLPPSLLSPLRVSVQFSFRCKRFGARSTVEMNSEWVMDTGARLMEGSVSNPWIWTSILPRDVCQYWNFYSYEILFFFLFSIFFQEFGPDLMIPLLLHDTSLAQIFIVSAYCCYFISFFFLEISCKYF